MSTPSSSSSSGSLKPKSLVQQQTTMNDFLITHGQYEVLSPHFTLDTDIMQGDSPLDDSPFASEVEEVTPPRKDPRFDKKRRLAEEKEQQAKRNKEKLLSEKSKRVDAESHTSTLRDGCERRLVSEEKFPLAPAPPPLAPFTGSCLSGGAANTSATTAATTTENTTTTTTVTAATTTVTNTSTAATTTTTSTSNTNTTTGRKPLSTGPAVTPARTRSTGNTTATTPNTTTRTTTTTATTAVTATTTTTKLCFVLGCGVNQRT
jgi:hypothetical protein